MKRALLFCLTVSLVLSAVGCTQDYEEIARSEYALDRGAHISGYDYAYGLSELTDRIQNVYENDENIIELGRDIVEPLVTFDEANLLIGDEYSFPTRLFYYVTVDFKSYELGTSPFANVTEEEAATFWASLAPDSTQTIREQVLETSKTFAFHTLASMYAYQDYGVELTDSYMASYENIFSFFGNEAALDEYYAAYGLSNEYLKQYLMYSSVYTALHEHLVGVDGIYYPTDEVAYSFFEDDCIYLQQIVFSYVKEDENGCLVYKSQEEIEASRAEGKELYAEIVNDPEQFIRNQYRTEHLTWKDNVNGYVYVPGDVLSEIEAAYSSLLPDEIVAVDTPIGYYIIKSLEKSKDVYQGYEDMILTAYCEAVFEREMSKYYSLFTYDESQYTRYKFSEILTY